MPNNLLFPGYKPGLVPVGNYIARNPKKVDPRLPDILSQAATNLGLKVEVFSGYRPKKGKSRHGVGQAVDVRIVDRETGKALPDYQDAKSFRAYEKLAQEARKVQQEQYPEMGNQFRWGGYFSGPPGEYGAVDLQHFDFKPGAPMAGGGWDEGMKAEQKKLWPGVESQGLEQQAASWRGAAQMQVEPAGQANPLDDSLREMMTNYPAAEGWFKGFKQPPSIDTISPAYRPLLEAKAKELGTDAATVLRRGWELAQPPAPVVPQRKPPAVTVERMGGVGEPTREIPVTEEAEPMAVPAVPGVEPPPTPGSATAPPAPPPLTSLPTPLSAPSVEPVGQIVPTVETASSPTPSTREQLPPEVQSILDSLTIVGGGEPPEIDDILKSLEAPTLPAATQPPREMMASPELQAYEEKTGAAWGGLAEFGNAVLLGAPYALGQKFAPTERATMEKEARELYQSRSPTTAMLNKVGGEIIGLGPWMKAGKAAIAPIGKGLEAVSSRLGAQTLTTTPGQVSGAAAATSGAAKLFQGTLGTGTYGEILPGLGNRALRTFSGVATGATKGAWMGAGLDLTNDETLAENILLGAMIGAPLEVAANGLGRLLTRYWQNKAAPGVKELINEASGLGIPNEALPPFSRLVQGAAPTQSMGVFQKSLENATKAVMKTMGSREKAATTSALQGVERDIQSVYNTVLPQIKVKADLPMNDFMVDMRARLRKLPRGDYKNRLLHAWTTLQDSMTETVVDAAGRVVRNPIWIDGTLWQKLVNKNGPLGAIINDNAAGEFKLYAREMRDSLKDLVTRSTANSNNGTRLLAQFDDANRRWKILQAVEKTMEKNPSGIIDMPSYLDQMIGHYGKLGAGTQEEVLAKLGKLYPEVLPQGTPAITEGRAARYVRAVFGYGALPVAAAGGAAAGSMLDLVGLAARSGIPGTGYTNPLLFGGMAAAGMAAAAARNKAMQKDLVSPEALNYLLGRWRAPGQSPFVKSVIGAGEKTAAGTMAVQTYSQEKSRRAR